MPTMVVDISISSELKEDGIPSKPNDEVRSLLESDQASVAYSTFTGVTKQATVTIPMSPSISSVDSSLLSPTHRSPRRKSRFEALLRLKAFKPKSDVPPLDFKSAGIVGRDAELSTLKSCYDRLLRDGSRELILVGGESGVGKSSLIRTMENFLWIEGLFVEGKFNMNTSNEPYSGVANAFGIICNEIKEAGPETIADLQRQLMKELGDTPRSLVQLIPQLKGIVAVEPASDSKMGAVDRVDETEGGVDRLRFAFRVLTRVFSSVFSPLILFLDDLQWSDVSSLQVLEYLISDTENKNPLMIIGSYRSEEVDENSLLHNKMVTLREKTGKHQFQMSEIMIQPFRATEIEQLITEVVPSLRADHMVGLAELCHKRTLGNPFFTIEFLKMIHLEGMLEFDKTTKTWSWDISIIENETMSTANVVVMLEQHLRKLPEQVQALLQCAAYLGSTFSEATIDLVWSVYGRRLVDKKTKPLSSLLPLLVNDHVFEECESRRYRWTHDKLQEAALALSDKRRDTFQLDIGKTLYYGLTKEEVEEDLFAIVDLINNGNTLKRPEFAVVNLRAAEKARSISAFQSAADYAEESILLLQETDWSDNKSTALRLYSIGVESQLILGNVDTADRYQKVVLPRSDLSTLEMLPFQIGRAKALGDVELKSKEALEYCLGLLNKLGCRLVWFRRLALPQAISKFIRIASQAYAMPQSFYDNLEASNDTKQKYIGYLLSKAAYNAYTAGDTAIYLLSTVKLVELTLEVGAQEFSASAFTFLAVFSIVVLKDYEKMERFQTIALGMLKKFRGMHVAESIFVGYQLGMFWVKPLEAGRVMAEEAILAGKREGDLVFTSWSMALHVMTLPYTTGRPLSTILEGCPTLLAEFEETKTTAHIVGTKNLYQMFVNLNDPSCKNPSVLSGDIYSYTDKDHKGNLVHLADKIVTEGELVFWNEDYEISAMRALKVGESHAKLAPANFLNQIESFHRAVALYAAAIRTKKRMYKSAANKIRKRIADLAQYGNTTLQYYNLLLTAEHLSLKRKPREAQQKYETAILVVSNLGHLHHLGLLNERYSDFLLRDLSLEKESRYRLEEAIRYYTEWGAVHKVKALESRL